MFPQNERDKVMYVKLSMLFLHGSYMCQQSSAWSATKPRSFVQLMGGGGTNFESATWLIGQLLQGQGSFEGFLQNEGVIERENQKKKTKKKKEQ